mgnify:FL=1
MADPLEAIVGSSYCPVCGCLSSKGVIRCPECSTFHAGAHLEEREAPSQPLPAREVDPGHYSLSGESGPVGESFEESDDIRSWEGGNTDFSFDEEEIPPAKLEDAEAFLRTLPQPEELIEE